MAVVITLRLAIALSPVVYRLMNGPIPSTGNQALAIALVLWNRIRDPGELVEDLNAALAAETSYDLHVADYTGTMELRKFVVRWSRTPAGGTVEDQDQITMHFAKLTLGEIDPAWDTTDYELVESAFGTFWGSIKDKYPSYVHLDQYRFYKSGPEWDVTPAPYNPAERTTEVDVAGSATAYANNSPQSAISVTEKTSVRKRWGRFYLPAPSASINTVDGRVASTTCTAWAAFVQTFFETCTAGGLQPVVFSRERAAYTSEAGHEIEAQSATAYSVGQIQIDDLYDVIRSRRYGGPTVRAVEDIAPVA